MVVNIEDTAHWWTDNGHCTPDCPECYREKLLNDLNDIKEVLEAAKEIQDKE